MRVIAIGATGFIGRHVIAQLVESGHEVAVLHRGNVPLSASGGVTEILGERSNLIELRNEFRKWAPDVVVDMILSSARQARETLEAFHGIASRVVAISSGDAYRAMAVLHRLDNGPIQPVPLHEDSALRTETKPYSAEALAGVRLVFPWINDEYDKVQVEEAIASDPELPATILRLPMVYGPGDLLHRLYSVVKRMLDGRPAILQEQTFAQWVPCRGYVENCGPRHRFSDNHRRRRPGGFSILQSENGIQKRSGPRESGRFLIGLAGLSRSQERPCRNIS